ARDESVSFVLRHAGDDDVGRLRASESVIRSADDVLRKIERHAELRTADDEKLLLNEWPHHPHRRKEVSAIRILSDAEQDRPDLKEYVEHSGCHENPSSFRLARVERPPQHDEDRHECWDNVDNVMRLLRSL